MSCRVIIDHAVGKWVAHTASVSHYNPFLSQSIGLVRGEKIVAGAIYTDYNGTSMVCHIAAEGPINAEFMYKICDYPFNQCKVNKVIGPVNSSNEKCIRFVKKMGFKEEARIKDAFNDGDMIFFTLVKEDCKFLGERYGKKCNPAPDAELSAVGC